VLTNVWPTGGARKFFDMKSVATLLRQQGYTTGFVGKYMNQYSELFWGGVPVILPGRYVPPGWNAFVAYVDDTPDWRQYRFNFGASGSSFTAGIALPMDAALIEYNLPGLLARGFPTPMAEYIVTRDADNPPHITEFESELALRFMEAATSNPGRPFLLILGSAAPHAPAIPDEPHRDLFPGFAYRKRGWGEADLSDKPAHIRRNAAKFPDHYDGTLSLSGDDRSADQFFGDQVRSLQGLDRTVGRLARWIEARPELASRTVFIYASDHGVLWGEHKVVGQKKLPYEESIRVPLIIRYPGLPARVSDRLVAADLDLGATLLHLGGYTDTWIETQHRSDGKSLLPLLFDPRLVPRREIPLQDYRAPALGSDPSWAGLRTDLWKYVQYDTLEEELYNLFLDRFEMESRHEALHAGDARARERLAAALESRRGLMILSPDWSDAFLPDGEVDQPYDFTFTAVGGNKPYAWSDGTGAFRPAREDCETGFPPGLSLLTDGTLAGIPIQAGCFEFAVQVRDTTVSPHHNGPQSHLRRGIIRIQD
jgi:arylsulfatase A-like enzyme